MSRRTLTHLQTRGTLTKCGKEMPPNRLVKNKRSATCRSCNPPKVTRSLTEAQVAARALDSYGDSNFKGTGKLRCRNCNQPYRDHPLAVPCPYGPDR